MNLEKEDLKEIKKIVDESVKKNIDVSVKKIVDESVEESEKRIITVISREVKDLADINRAVINRTDELDYRLKIVERKLGIRTR